MYEKILLKTDLNLRGDYNPNPIIDRPYFYADLSISDSRFNSRTIIHELGHVLGLRHGHQSDEDGV